MKCRLLTWFYLKQDWDKCLQIGTKPRKTGREKVISWPVKYKLTFSFFWASHSLLIITVSCSCKHLMGCREVRDVENSCAVTEHYLTLTSLDSLLDQFWLCSGFHILPSKLSFERAWASSCLKHFPRGGLIMHLWPCFQNGFCFKQGQFLSRKFLFITICLIVRLNMQWKWKTKE